MFDIQEELKKLPAKPGVYIMKDKSGEIIYVGKAVKLKNRVRQYFQDSRGKSAKIQKMVSLIDSFEYIITDSEMEALILECNLIKEHSPRYNTMLKDDKTYPYIKITVGEPYPRVFSTRIMKRDKSRYFGPYTTAKAVKDTIELLRKLYGIRTCNKVLKSSGNDFRTCLYYHMGQCQAPCQDRISPEEYRKNINKAIDFLNGKYDDVLKELTEKMYEASEKWEYERAGEYKELIDSVKLVVQKQKITGQDLDDKDIIAIAREDNEAVAQVFFVRDGKLIGREHFYLKNIIDTSRQEMFSGFVKQFYSGTPFIPKQVILQEEIEDKDLIEEWLTLRRKHKVSLVFPKIGEKEKLVDLAYRNAQLVLSMDRERLQREEARTVGAMKRLSELLGIPEIHRIEAYDISHISGTDAVGAMVVYEDGRPKKADYRKFRIQGMHHGNDDYASMREVLKRRLLRGIEAQNYLNDSFGEEKKNLFPLFPDLILMDGGKGQVNIALDVLKELGLHIEVCGMVKDDSHRTRGLYYNNQEILTDRSDECLKMITAIQDEVHRFAISYHKSLRSKRQVRSILDNIEGIGEIRRKALMKKFGSIEAIAKASVEEINSLSVMDERSSENVYNYFRKENNYEIREE